MPRPRLENSASHVKAAACECVPSFLLLLGYVFALKPTIEIYIPLTDTDKPATMVEKVYVTYNQVHKLCQDSADRILNDFKPNLMIAIGGGGCTYDTSIGRH